MKRNYLFLGATAFSLALAGIVAAKEKKHVNVVSYTTASNDCANHTCGKITIGAVTTTSGGNRFIVNGKYGGCYSVSGVCFPLYTGA